MQEFLRRTYVLLAIGVLVALIVLGSSRPAYAYDWYLPDTVGVRDVAYDTLRDVLYMSKGAYVYRYDFEAGAALPPVLVGINLYGMDIEADGDHLLVADKTGALDVATVRRVDLRDWSSEDVTASTGSFYAENGALSVAGLSDGGMLMSPTCVNYGWGFLRIWDAARGTWSTLDTVTSLPEGGTVLESNATKDVVTVVEQNIIGGLYGIYRVPQAQYMMTQWPGAVIALAPNAAGTRFVLGTTNSAVLLDESLNVIATLSNSKCSNAAFSPDGKYIYLARPTQADLLVLDSTTLLPVCEFGVNSMTSLFREAYVGGRMAFASGGQTIFVTTADGVYQRETMPKLTLNLVGWNADRTEATLSASARMNSQEFLGRTLYLQSSTDGITYEDIASLRLDTSTVSFVVRPTGEMWYRVRTDGSSNHLPGESLPLVPRVAVDEIEGSDRFATAVAASQHAFPDGLDPAGARTIVIATGRNWPDALGGAGLAGILDAPVLLVDTTSIPPAVTAEIVRLNARKAIILGGTSAVGPSVETLLKNRFGASNVERIAGADRYATADSVALRVIESAGAGYDGTAFFTTGANFPDALAAAPLAASKGWPLFLVSPTKGLSSRTSETVRSLKAALILGSTTTVSQSVENTLKGDLGSDNVRRLAGSDRYVTAAAVAGYAVAECGMHWDAVGLATGYSYPDALAGGILQGKADTVMLLTAPKALSPAVSKVLSSNKTAITRITFFGSTEAIGQATRTSALQSLR